MTAMTAPHKKRTVVGECRDEKCKCVQFASDPERIMYCLCRHSVEVHTGLIAKEIQ